MFHRTRTTLTPALSPAYRAREDATLLTRPSWLRRAGRRGTGRGEAAVGFRLPGNHGVGAVLPGHGRDGEAFGAEGGEQGLRTGGGQIIGGDRDLRRAFP